jgi:hypothetical protein
MRNDKIKLEERFTAFELAEMFNVDCDPSCMDRKTVRVRHIDEPYAFNDTKVPLLVRRKRRITKRVKHYDDRIKPGVTEFGPGTKQRHADLVRFYAENAESEISPFEGDDE